MIRLKYLIIIFLSIFYSCSGCINTDNSKEKSITGKYINRFEPNANHYVELRPDSTYLHYYQKGTTVNKNSGKWVLLNQDGIKIMFHDWTDYGYKNEPICNGCYRAVELKDGELYFDYDLSDEVNFIKSI